MIRAIIQQVKEGVIKLFTAAGMPDESFTNREYFQHYGFTSRPLSGAEGIIIKEGNHIIMIASDDRRYRIAVLDGEVCIYTDEGDYVHFKRGKEIYVKSGNKLKADIENDVEINTKRALITASESATVQTVNAIITASAMCQINSPQVNLSSDRTSLRRLIDERFKELFNQHTHPGVQTGSGSTGVPTQQITENDHMTNEVRGK